MTDAAFTQRFAGIARLYGEQGLANFRCAHVAVIGLGGVGSWVAEALARSGIGELTLIDQDDICQSNINRQIHALSDSVGQSKVTVMAERVRQIQPECLVHEQIEFINRENVELLLDPSLDYVVDAIDSVADKAALITACKRVGIPVICVGGAGGQLDPLQVTVADLSKTHNDPLAAKLRSLLRRHYGFSRNRKMAVECVYSTEQLRYPQGDGTVALSRPPTPQPGRLDCAGGFGATSVVTATFAMVAAARVLAQLAEQG